MPAIFPQHASETDQKVDACVEFLVEGPNFNRIGSARENYALLKLDALVKSKIVNSDIYWHQRILGRVVDMLDKPIPIYKIGDAKFDKSYAGILRPMPSSSTPVTPTGVKEPNHTLVTQVYELEVC